VGVLERGRILEAVAERAIHADVCEPDEPDLDRPLRTPNDSHRAKHDREDLRVELNDERGDEDCEAFQSKQDLRKLVDHRPTVTAVGG